MAMKNILKYTLLNSLFPFVFICYHYNQNHGFFAESYESLYILLGYLLFINVCLHKLGYAFVNSLWIVIFLPSFNTNLYIEFILKLLTLSTLYFIIKKLPQKLLYLLCTLIIMLNLAQIIQRDVGAKTKAMQLLKLPTSDIIFSNENIYWIICDAYASLDTLKNYYHFDNTSFYDQLKTLGFKTLDNQLKYNEVNNFPTLKALNYYANFNSFDVTKENSLTLHYCLKDNQLFNILKKKGYKIYGMQSRAPFLHKLNIETIGSRTTLSTLQLSYYCFKQNKYISKLLETKLNKKLYEHQENNFYFLENLPNNFKHSFFYIHIDSPHAPFVRDANNYFNDDQKSIVWGENEVGENAYSTEDYRSLYKIQLEGLNKKLLKCLKQIISKDPKATIILQGDHGTFTTQDLQEQKTHLLAVKSENVEQNLLEKFIQH